MTTPKPLGTLLETLPRQSFYFQGAKDAIIQHITWDFQQVVANSLYFCLEEEEFQEEHIQPSSLAHWKQAVENGATALVCSKSHNPDLPDSVSLIQVENVNQAMALIAREFYAHPFQKMKTIGVTGTNGKTTTSQFLDSIFSQEKGKTGSIGTIGVFYPDEQETASHLSNPLSTELFAIADKMVEKETQTLIMEVTSHGMAFHRNYAVDFDIAVFTNLTQDHLDYHKTFENYKKAKLEHFKRLGSLEKKAYGIVNIDDAAGSEFIQAIPKERLSTGKVSLLTYGIRNKDADLVAYPRQMTGGYSEFDVFLKGNPLASIHLPMPGLFNIYNAVAAFGAAFASGISIHQITNGLESAAKVSGRFEKVTNTEDLDVYIDYAHTPDSLENIIQAVRPLTRRKLLVIFGAGGDRDRSKRALMGEISARLADISIVTSDNPRTEDPGKILEDILEGMKDIPAEKLLVEKDREKAIHMALQQAKPGDAVLIAGKGHETYQIIGHEKFHFSDREKVEEFFTRKQPPARRVWIEIDQKKLDHNFSLIQKDMPEGLDFTAVVKDDGCGHGSVVMAKSAIKAGAKILAVACMSEAMELRENGIRDFPVLVFGERVEYEIPTCIDLNLSLQVQSFEIAELISQQAIAADKKVAIHFKVDTGMGRYGIRWDQAAEIYRKIYALPGIMMEGIMTHFAQSDEQDKTYANLQWSRFQEVLDELAKEDLLPDKIHACNSGGYLDLPHCHGSMVRLGALPTGVYPSKVCRRIEIEGETLKPVMQVKTRVAFLKTLLPGDYCGYGMHFKAEKETLTAVLPFGYGDGYPRMRNQGKVLIRGKWAPVIGGMAMDATMVDVTHIKGLKQGDEVVLMGLQGEEEITARDIAEWSGTVTYDILSRWNRRVERRLL